MKSKEFWKFFVILSMGLLLKPVYGEIPVSRQRHINGATSYEEHTWKRDEYRRYTTDSIIKNQTKPEYESYEKYLTPARRDYREPESVKIRQKKTSQEKGKKAPRHYKKHPPIYIKYYVKKNDTLYGISKKYKISIDTLCSINRINSRHLLKRGASLKIPKRAYSRTQTAPKTSQVKKKENPQFSWPLKNVVQYKKDARDGVKSIGIIITGKPGSTVISSARGVVKKVGQMRGFGNYIVITHKNRYATVYANVDSVFVSTGQHISTGKVIGKIGPSARTIHFQIDYAGKPQNPLKYLPKRG